MARTKAQLTDNFRESDFLTLASLLGVVPFEALCNAMTRCGLATQRYRKLPLELMAYYVICLSLYSSISLQEVLHCILEGFEWLKIKMPCGEIKGRGGISRARNRLGYKVMQCLFEDVCKPMALPSTIGAFYRGWRLMAIDGTTFDLPDEQRNHDCFGYPPCSRGKSAFPQLRMTALLEIGTRAIVGAAYGPYSEGENMQGKRLIRLLQKDMLLLADRGFGCYPFFSECIKTGASLVFRIRGNMKFAREKILPDGSFLSTFHPGTEQHRKNNGIPVRVIEYTIKGSSGKYRLITSILKAEDAPASELAALYHERWEIELAYDELKNHLKQPGTTLRSKTPELVIQELFGYLLAHYTIRSLIHQAARKNKIDPDRLSFINAVRILCRKITAAHFPPQTTGN